jgi:NTE family protein
VVHLIYKNKSFEGHYKDYEFSKDTMREHWASGLDDIRRSFGHPEWLAIPSRETGFVTRDVHRYRQDVSEADAPVRQAAPQVKRNPDEARSNAR